jgi:hypothetical protein
MNLKSLFAPVIFLIVISISTYGQTQNNKRFIEGEVLVQLTGSSALTQLEKRFNPYDLQSVQTVSARFNIYLLRFNTAKTKHSDLLSALQREKSVVNAQNNHYVELRNINDTTPDDPRFNQQWPLKNTGQGGGLPDADIDADEAWEITTGGETALGDQIVIAIVDGGTDLNHEDMDFWKNTHEVPNNGNDDDGNGYIDDYDGWNAYDHNGQIPQHNHGVHVGGIAGAIGNNGKGVSGVNWNVKILPVAGSSSTSEATVVEALSYVYTVRETYDQTNGAKGAFVVADNCSFGVDKGNPASFPIWEAMYDSLGQLGILSMGATANQPWDIDSVGDVPTAFATDYMISVTNTTKLDELYFSAGYGDTTIDLGAPGTIVMSCRVNNGYGNSSGTSMATPHVTGAAALILSAADSVFMVNYKNQPAEGALLIKGFIMDGVKKLNSLLNITVSGGRLNVFKSINLMLNAPVLVVDKDSVKIALQPNHTGQKSILLKNTGVQDLNYSISIPNQPDWISLSQNSGTLAQDEEETVFLNFDSEGLDNGLYHCHVVIEGNRIFSKTIAVEMLVDTNVGIQETELLTSSVTVFPNPFSKKATFDIHTRASGEAVLEIFDPKGSVIYTKSQSISSGKTQLAWENVNSPKGIYFYKISVDGQVLKTGKLVKK